MRMFEMTKKEARFVKNRKGYWWIADVTFNPDGTPKDWEALSKIDKRIYRGPLPKPEDFHEMALFYLSLYDLPRVIETSVNLIEMEARNEQ